MSIFFDGAWRVMASLPGRCFPLLILMPMTATAQLTWTGSIDTQYEYNSNVFALQPGFSVPNVKTPPYSDTLLAYGAKLDATYLWDQQQIRVQLGTVQYDYDTFGQLNHLDYNFGSSWKGRLSSAVDGLLAVSRQRSMLDLYYVSPPELVLQTQQLETGELGVALSSAWRMEASAYSRHDQDPVEDAPHLGLAEAGGQAALKYIEVPGTDAGVSVGYLQGTFSGANATVAPAYHQEDFDLTLEYKATDISAFSGHAGYSRRESAFGVVGGINSIAAPTWDLTFQHAVSDRTLLEADLSRLISSYITNTGSSITTRAALKANWQATYRITVMLDYSYLYQQLPLQGGVFDGPFNGTNRIDRFNLVRLELEYRLAPWLSLEPYAQFQNRRSTNFLGGDFNASIVGIEIALQWEHGAPPELTPFEVQPR